jgi:tryptophan-rich sensory protein
LYLFIGIAGWLLWRSGGWDRVLTLWAVQLLLNLAWTPLFFAAEQYVLALVDIVALVLAVGVLIAWSWPRSRLAAWLLAPYLVWVCFATALNAAIVVLN